MEQWGRLLFVIGLVLLLWVLPEIRRRRLLHQWFGRRGPPVNEDEEAERRVELEDEQTDSTVPEDFSEEEFERFRQRSEAVRHGYEREERIAAYLCYKRGANVELSAGSRGPWDVRAIWVEEIWHIQVKSSIGGNPRWPRPAEINNLVASCRRNRNRGRRQVVPVVARSKGQKTIYYHAITRERIIPPNDRN